MSVIRKEPFIQKLIKDLTAQQKTSLLGVINGEKDLVNASFSNMPADAITPVLFQLDNQNSKTGILVLSSHYRVLIAYHRFQDLLMIKLNSNNTYEKINEYLDINELRRLVEEADDHIVASEIDSGSATENQVLAADGDGGAEWVDVADTIKESNVDTGDAVKLFGFDSEGNLVADDLPEGILVDNTVIEDSPNAVSGGAVYDELADIKEDVTDINGELETKANVDGNYPTMTVGVADALTPYDSDSGGDQDKPFSFQATGTGNGTQPDFSTGAIALMKEKRGNSVVVNQLVYNGTFTNTDGWAGSEVSFSVENNVATLTSNGNDYGRIISYADSSKTISGHKYLNVLDIRSDDVNSALFSSGSGWKTTNITSSWATYFAVADSSSSSSNFVLGFTTNVSSGNTIQFRNVNFIDLTQWFNGDIPDDLERHPENFFRYYQGSLAYNAGTLVNANGRYVKCIGMNQWDEEWKEGSIDQAGNVIAGSAIHSKNLIKVIPNTEYYFKVGTGGYLIIDWFDKDGNNVGYLFGYGRNDHYKAPANAVSMKFAVVSGYGKTYKNDISINLYYEKSAGVPEPRCLTYEPYQVLTNNDTGTEVLLSAGSVSDSKKPDGTITRRVGVVDLSTLTWTDEDVYKKAQILDMKPYDYSQHISNQCICEKYYEEAGQTQTGVGSFSLYQRFIYIKTTETPSGFCNYTLETPTTEQGTPYSENLFIDDFGSMDFAGTNGVPQGNLIFYPVDYKAFIDTLYNYTDGTPSELAKKSDLSGLVSQEDLSSGITDVAGLTYEVKKAYKTGNVVTLTIRATNLTGSTISADTTLFSLSSSLYNSAYPVFANAVYPSTATAVTIWRDGNVHISENLVNEGYLVFTVSYAVA